MTLWKCTVHVSGCFDGSIRLLAFIWNKHFEGTYSPSQAGLKFFEHFIWTEWDRLFMLLKTPGEGKSNEGTMFTKSEYIFKTLIFCGHKDSACAVKKAAFPKAARIM